MTGEQERFHGDSVSAYKKKAVTSLVLDNVLLILPYIRLLVVVIFVSHITLLTHTEFEDN